MSESPIKVVPGSNGPLGQCFDVVLPSSQKLMSCGGADAEKRARNHAVEFNNVWRKLAGPELLESCQYIDSAAPNDCDAYDENLVTITVTEKGLRDLRAAIAKAVPLAKRTKRAENPGQKGGRP